MADESEGVLSGLDAKVDFMNRQLDHKLKQLRESTEPDPRLKAIAEHESKKKSEDVLAKEMSEASERESREKAQDLMEKTQEEEEKKEAAAAAQEAKEQVSCELLGDSGSPRRRC